MSPSNCSGLHLKVNLLAFKGDLFSGEVSVDGAAGLEVAGLEYVLPLFF